MYLTGFYSNSPTKKDISDIVEFINSNNLKPKIGKVFEFENIKDALICQDKKIVDGKIVVKMKG